ncbi:uncharacterized protein BP01DRAFT_374959 [Aspergillus saccharolyticus JOP 1030-1]|uniref:Rhodopsin domain-containing protein n=1 Tax=Aspergillus saccharolyticus JOP 1030-1 TaxID=1450539 RepID=A0A319AAY5_9EURO|nr:hypothetical protein BP01DRAFT_374959 [Aspergillus saccharolyticus JOP 1030-1]PYH44102.1 hypothetical protein BP01DRAFT_374959 [Aspergillus saccharolyticus JOP 1030-1]
MGVPPDHRTTGGILAEYYLLTALALFWVALRVWVRIRLTRNWGWDDTCIVLAWLPLFAGLVLIQIEANLGLGRHMIYLQDAETAALQILKYNTFFQMLNVLCTLLTKYSISLYLLRIRDDRRLRLGLGVLMLLMTLATIAVIVVLSVSCIPLQRLWDKSVPGTCLALAAVYNVAYVQSGFTIVVDLCLTMTPIIVLWDVKIKRGRKTMICGLMSLGLIATVSNALRNDFQSGLTSADMTYDMTAVSVVAILELSSGIIAACIPACAPLLRRNPPTSTMAQSTAYYAPHAGGRSLGGINGG